MASTPDGSFLVRHTTKSDGMDVLILKYNDEFRNYNMKTDGDSVWISRKRKFKSVSDLISDLSPSLEKFLQGPSLGIEEYLCLELDIGLQSAVPS